MCQIAKKKELKEFETFTKFIFDRVPQMIFKINIPGLSKNTFQVIVEEY